MSPTFPQRKFELEFPELISQNHVMLSSTSMPGNPAMML